MNGDFFGNARLYHNLIDTIPDPNRAIAHKGETHGFGGPQAMQMHGNEFGHRIWPRERAVDRHFLFSFRGVLAHRG